MSERELRDKYGGKLAKAINRAIRAEVPGGNEALDRLTHLAGAARHSHWKDHAGHETPEAAAYFKHKKEVVDRMDADVRRRWGVPADDGQKTRRRKASGPPSGSQKARPPRARSSKPGPRKAGGQMGRRQDVRPA